MPINPSIQAIIRKQMLESWITVIFSCSVLLLMLYVNYFSVITVSSALIGVVISGLRMIREPLSINMSTISIRYSRKDISSELLDYIDSFGKVYFSIILWILATLLVLPFIISIIRNNWWTVATPITAFMALLAGAGLSLGLCRASVFIRIVRSWRHIP